MKVRFKFPQPSHGWSPVPPRNLTAELTPTTHPKGGEAWTVTVNGREIGTLRRWSRKESSMHLTPTSGSFSSRDVTKWTAYPPEKEGRVWSSRGAALASLFAAAEVSHG